MGRMPLRYSASEKLEIIHLVEESALPVRRTLEKIGIPRATFYRWYDLYRADGPEALDDRAPKPDRVWNRIPDDVRERDRKSTRLNSSHLGISYAVFCLKKKKKINM